MSNRAVSCVPTWLLHSTTDGPNTINPLMRNICTPPLMQNMGQKGPTIISQVMSPLWVFSLFYLLKSIYFMIEYSNFSLNILFLITTNGYFNFSFHTLWIFFFCITTSNLYTWVINDLFIQVWYKIKLLNSIIILFQIFWAKRLHSIHNIFVILLHTHTVRS